MVNYIQSNFSGGMDLFSEDYTLDESSYGLAYNIRNRTTALLPIAGPLEDTGAPEGLKQGIYAFDDYLILFSAGKAHFKNIVTDGNWTEIANFAMSTSADFIYTEAVPASKNNYAKKLQEGNRIDGSSAETNINVAPTLINTTAAGLVCQDGQTQGYIILPDGTARKLQTYNEWSLTNREYVPIMTRLKYVNGILFGVASDGVTIYRSVSGRPLDFVVNIDVNGNKGGNASTTAYNVSYLPITCISTINSGELFISTAKTCHPVGFNYDRTIFAEPTFTNTRSFSAGVVNHHSFIDILGDYSFVDFDGIRSYNAVSALQNEGRNSIFSSRISKAFASIKQSEVTTAAIVFDNYSIFAVSTIYGNVLAVYDNSRAVWVCFDNLGISGVIKQFAVANQSASPTLYAITATKLYKLYKSTDELEAMVYLRAITSGKASSNIRLPSTHIVFDGGLTEDTAHLTQIIDNVTETTVDRTIASLENGSCESILFKDLQAKQGWKIQPKLIWQNEAKVAVVEVMGEEITNQVSLKQRAQLSNS